MALMNRLEQSKIESLHMRSANVLESDSSLLTLGHSTGAGLDKLGGRKFALRLTNKDTGFHYEFIEEGQGKWTVLENGMDMAPLIKGNITEEGLGKVLENENPLVRKSILGITEQKGLDGVGSNTRNLIKKGLSHVGLSVSKDGSIQEMNPAKIVKGQERS